MKNPGFTTVAVLTLGLRIGAATAMFGLIQGVLLSPPPYADPDQCSIPSGSCQSVTWIDSEWGTSENNRKAKFYKLTPAGRKQLVQETSNWERLSTAINLILKTT